MALLHDDLKAMGINSVGHRLTILKSVYDVKKAQDVPVESDHYVPLSKYSTTNSVMYGLNLTIGNQLRMPRRSMRLQHSRT